MRWHSTPESLQEGKPSFLAILETIAAITISLIFAHHIGSVKYIAIGSCIAPLLLLSSERSSTLALNWGDYIYRKLYYLYMYSEEHWASSNFPKLLYTSIPSLIVTIIFWLGTIISIFFIKILTTTLTCIWHPFYTLKAFPLNWRRNVLCTDFFAIPELIPGIESIDRYGVKLEFFRFRNLVSTMFHIVIGEKGSIISKNETHGHSPIEIIAVILFLFPCYIYRWSLKSTALIWSPLLWVLRESNDDNLRLRLDQISNSAIHRIPRYYSTIVIIIFLIKIYSYVTAQQLTGIWHYINLLIIPHEIPVWQLTAVTNAMITWLLYFAADWYLIKYKHEKPVPENLLKKVLHILTTIRWPLTFYTIFCELYIFVNWGLRVNWPHLGSKLFPWQ